jgi:hypothetical protein
MFLNIPLIANLQAIQERRQILINKNLRQQNLKRQHFDYVINQEVLVKVPQLKKLDNINEGPYQISQVHTNGTIMIQ